MIPGEDRAPPRAVILAAGVGRRLGIDHPKCLLRIGGRTLLDRHLDHLGRLGVDEVVLVLGHQKDRIEHALQGRTGIRILMNPDYRR
ncbi:MAG: NTP transferase domain-containing protein, partial [Beggiatoa sp.]|nr:NTP transferase domain-containing protein [Beggiatoa sp.]